MKRATILHNPKAGEGEYSKKKLLTILRSSGIKCSYSSTKKNGLGKNRCKSGRPCGACRWRWYNKESSRTVAR
jgi:hypothetical protein